MASFADRLKLELVDPLLPDYRERLDALRHELIRQAVVDLEVAARQLTRDPRSSRRSRRTGLTCWRRVTSMSTSSRASPPRPTR